jgi:hypothetical protein
MLKKEDKFNYVYLLIYPIDFCKGGNILLSEHRS